MVKKDTLQHSSSKPSRDQKVDETTSPKTSSRQLASKIDTPTKGTKITIEYPLGSADALYIRGSGESLSWTEGTPLLRLSASTWLWESDIHFGVLEFKILLNDESYEAGSNRVLISGTDVNCTPEFHND